jgi:hypothetical protein
MTADWLDQRFLEWLLLVVVIAMFAGCSIWRMSGGVGDDHRPPRAD